MSTPSLTESPPQPGSDPVRLRLAELAAVLKVQDRPGRPLQDAWAESLSQARFDWFTTFTFRRNVSEQTAQEAWADWVRWLRRKQGHRAEWFLVRERTAAGAVHFHALVGRCAGLRRLSALDYWRHRYGFGQVKRFSPGLGAHYYLSKYVSKGASGELDCQFSRRYKLLLGGVRSGKGGTGYDA
jgi:hypothetical protein